jgi:hypothetical protein
MKQTALNIQYLIIASGMNVLAVSLKTKLYINYCQIYCVVSGQIKRNATAMLKAIV